VIAFRDNDEIYRDRVSTNVLCACLVIGQQWSRVVFNGLHTEIGHVSKKIIVI